MSRRDTIITAVLINAGLLVVLFVSALKTDAKPAVAKQESAPQKTEIALQKPTLKREVAPTPAPKVEKPVVAKSAPEPVKKAPPPAPKKAVTQEMKTIVVQSGDALEKIARRHKVSVADIITANGLKNNQLKIGQKLNIPVSKKGISHQKDPRFYVVRAGDSPWTIASKNKIKLGELLRLNDLDEASAKKLKPGDKLRIE